ncbi:hypothetical protein [Roseovarius sp. A-2]|uniref:hypothetical protein n=1 Tax=Roseovarius sp. A-2 TaxID=1570360 RepID=UPI0020CB2FBD|nr:hypothetical protein [Roseovarius sp. A-2]
MTKAAGGAGAWFDLAELPVRQLTFVRPAPASDDRHVAWYSRETVLRDAVIQQAGAHLGRRDGEPFAHVHGMWTDQNGACHAGHLLAEKTILSADHIVDVWQLEGALFESALDVETGFNLFRPIITQQVGNPNAVLGTIRPNELIEEGIAKCAAATELSATTVKGLGSLAGTQLEGQLALNDVATEVLLLGADGLSVIAVGFEGAPITGEMAPLSNRVCVTFEVLLLSHAE